MTGAPESATDVSTALSFTDVSKSFRAPDGSPRWALRPTSFAIPSGETVAVIGRSGSGKSTLLHLAAGIEPATTGRVDVLGQDLTALSDAERARLRRDRIGIVFQFFHLVPHLSVLDNVLLPAMIAGDVGRFRERGIELLHRVELQDRIADGVDRLSGGEMQRVAICRALLRRPALLLADEPTGNLDDATGRTVMSLMNALVREEECTLVIVTHSRELAEAADRRFELRSGELTAR